MRSVASLSLAMSNLSALQCLTISSQASCGMIFSLAWARANAASKSRYFCTRFSSENTLRIAGVVKMSRNTAESSRVEGISGSQQMLGGTLAFLAGRSTCCAHRRFGPKLRSVREAVMNVNAKPEAGFRLEPVHPKPEEAHTMPYAPAVHIVGACDLMFLSGATPSPLYHCLLYTS